MGQELLKPDLQLRVVKHRPIRVAFVDELDRPGLYSLSTSETTQTKGGPTISINVLRTVVDAIQKDGGRAQQAVLRQALLQRGLPVEQVRYKQAQLNMVGLIQESRQSQSPI